MKRHYFVWLLIIVNFSCTSSSNDLKQEFSKEYNLGKDFLLNAARWELYKLNISWTSTVHTPTILGKTYERCGHDLIPFANYVLDTYRIKKQQDTISIFFNTAVPSCQDAKIAQFVYRNGTTYYPYYGVRYISGAQEGIYSGNVIYKLKSEPEKDTLFAKFLQLNQDSITNKWLLNYAQRFLRK